MSDITDLDVQQMLFCMYTILAGSSILIYDHMLTLPEEITFIWRRPKALPAMLFLLNRYFALFANISSLVVYFQPVISDESCSKFSLYRELALFLQGVIVSVIMAMRLYALYGCSKRLLIWIVIVMFVLGAVCCAGTFGQYSGDVDVVPGVSCNETFSKAMYVVLISVLCASQKSLQGLPNWAGICGRIYFRFVHFHTHSVQDLQNQRLAAVVSGRQEKYH
ncbi:hypothetical protein EDD22DRAFT_887559 [Suillus occidentalis]|nr:hypothetical protein EDD22DRAFT_887559 [Suillus occidentalis]